MALHPAQAGSKVEKFFKEHPSIEVLRLQWIDYTATVRTRMVSSRQAHRLAENGLSISVASPLTTGFLVDGSFNVINAGAKDLLFPDWTTLVVCHYQPKHAAVMCFIEESGHGFESCPRSLLKRVEHEVGEKQNVRFLVGVEVEFYLTPLDDTTAPVKDIDPYCSTASLRTPYLAILEESVRAMELADIPVWTFHTETIAGQFEIALDPMTPLRAADAIVYAHEAIRTIATRHGFCATMHPKPFDNMHSVGQHFHISLSQCHDQDSFLAGVLASVPAISAIAMPTYDSYLRREFIGGDWVSWDTENRLCSVRKIRNAYWEFRFIDAVANNYLTLAAILGVGMAAQQKCQPLTMKPLGGLMSDALNDAEKRKELGIVDRCPLSLKEALDALKKDEAVKAALGDHVWDSYIKYKEKEEQMLAGLTLPERRKLIMQIF